MKTFALRKIRENFAEVAYSSNLEKLSKELLIDIIRDLSHLCSSQKSTLIKKINFNNRNLSLDQQSLSLNSFFKDE
jgi:hypothetical protein